MLALLAALSLTAPSPASPPASLPHVEVVAEDLYEADVAFALDAIEEQCATLLRLKDIDWKRVRKEFTKEAKKVRSDQEHWVLLQRLIARVQDGHARVNPLAEIELPEEWDVKRVGPGFFLCRVGKRYYAKVVWSTAEEVGLAPGMEVLSIDETPVGKWIDARIEEVSDMRSFSTEQHALHWVLNRGFQKPEGDRLKIEFKDGKKKRKRTISYRKASSTPEGPAVILEGYESVGDSVRWARSPRGFGYLHFRRTQPEVVEELDAALAAMGDLDAIPGMILDFRGNSGGGCDHEAFEARFVPLGQEMERLVRDPLPGAGPKTYGGPLVVIVDGTVVSAGETTSGMFKEDGRAYMIGESPTAGMSSQKTTFELPSGLFELKVSIGSNRSSFNGGRGIEGIGVPPHELVEFDPEELAAGVDTLIRRAEELLEDFPQKEVRYDPADHGWGE